VRLDFVTIFPDYFAPLELSLLGKARERGTVDVRVHDLRNWTDDVHRTVDDSPYGGGPGMIMRPEPWGRALEELTGRTAVARRRAGGPEGGVPPARIVIPTPAGRRFDQAYAADFATAPWLIVCCGRYEGIDARVAEAWADDEVSVGDYVLAGGELAALVIVETVVRLLPGVLGNAESAGDDSFGPNARGLLEAPSYTRPARWEGRSVPEVLRSGDHGAIARWRHEQSVLRTRLRRPDLLEPEG
jgi:tRNA (guanine37-N1)-methyltransferase